MRDLERVVYSKAFVVIDPGATGLRHGQVLTEEMYSDAFEDHGDDLVIRAGGEAVFELLRTLDLQKEQVRVRAMLPPGLRPILRREDGSATSDLTDQYQRIIERDIRLRRLRQISAPGPSCAVHSAGCRRGWTRCWTAVASDTPAGRGDCGPWSP